MDEEGDGEEEGVGGGVSVGDIDIGAVSQHGLSSDGAVFLTVTAAIDAVVGRSVAWKRASIYRGALCDHSYGSPLGIGLQVSPTGTGTGTGRQGHP